MGESPVSALCAVRAYEHLSPSCAIHEETVTVVRVCLYRVMRCWEHNTTHGSIIIITIIIIIIIITIVQNKDNI